MRSVKTSTEPASKLLISVADAKLHCHTTHDDEDSWFEDIIAQIYDRITRITSMTILETTYELRDNESGSEIIIPKYPCSGISEVGFVDKLNAKTALASSAYGVFLEEQPQKIIFASCEDVYNAAPEDVYSYYVDFGCGSATPADVPDWMKQFALNYTAAFYSMRERTDPTGTALDPIKTLDAELQAYDASYL